MSPLLAFPDEIIVEILSQLSLTELLQNVNRTCKRLHSIIEENSYLWRNVETDNCVEISSNHLRRILKHSSRIESFLLPFADILCETYELDYLFVTRLCYSKHLYWLDLSKSHLSTLCFLQHTPALTLLNLSECFNLVDSDFNVISTCKNLDQLYLGFTNISSSTVVNICSQLQLMVLDLSGIYINSHECNSVINEWMFILFVTFSEEVQVHEVVELQRNHLDCCINVIRLF